MIASEIVVPLEHPRFGSIGTISSPVQVEGFQKETPTAAPELGQHTCDVLREMGHTDDEIERLIATGVVEQFH